MTYEKFKKTVKESIDKRLSGDDIEVVLESIKKNNGVFLDSLTIRDKQINISPTIYLNNYYDLYLQDENITLIVEQIIQEYKRHKLDKNVNLDFFNDYEQVKDKILFKLINREKNIDLLKDVPFVEYLDFAIVFYYSINNSEIFNQNASILIKNEFLKVWNCTVEKLMENAIVNTPKCMGLNVRNIYDVLTGLHLDTEGLDDVCSMPIFVATNDTGINGAACILYKDMLMEMSDKLNADLFVIPCSVHEVILMPVLDMEYQNPTTIKESILFVNENEISQEDFLSNNLYIFNRKENALGIFEL